MHDTYVSIEDVWRQQSLKAKPRSARSAKPRCPDPQWGSHEGIPDAAPTISLYKRLLLGYEITMCRNQQVSY